MPVKRAVGIVSIYIAGDVNIYLYCFVNVLAPVCAVCLCVFLWYQIRVLVKNHMFQTSVNWPLSKEQWAWGFGEGESKFGRNLRKGVGNIGGGGGLHKIGVLATLCQQWIQEQ